jgi:glycosyltransferase involved in cell wall biosynthesis
MRRPVVVHVTTTDISLELLLGPQLRAFRDAGFRVIGMSAPGPYVAALDADGIEHIAVQHATRAMALGSDLRALAELHQRFRGLRPDIVHTHNPKPGVYGRISAKLAAVPVVVNTVHGLYAMPEDPWPRRAIVYGLERVATTCSQAELVQNPEDLETLARLRVPRRKLHLLGNGIDLGRFDPTRLPEGTRERVRAELGIARDEVLCGVVGRLVWEKGYREVFAAAARLRARRPEVGFVVIGPEDTTKADGLGPPAIEVAEGYGVRFLGVRHDMEALYAAMDIYVLASHREGFPRSAMEAASMGLPIVATDIRGCRQVVHNGVTGHLVPRADSRALADAIEALVVDPEGALAMGRAGRTKALREFDQSRVIDLTLGVYDDLLDRARLAS